MSNLVDRLRGVYVIPVDDGAGPLNGSDTFTRTFPVPRIHTEAADEIERLRGMLQKVYDNLTAIQCCDAVVGWRMDTILQEEIESTLYPKG